MFSYQLLLIKLYRNEAYRTRVQLAITDHNAHLGRHHAQNKDGEYMYTRKFCKQTKKWDTTPTMEKKNIHTFQC